MAGYDPDGEVFVRVGRSAIVLVFAALVLALGPGRARAQAVAVPAGSRPDLGAARRAFNEGRYADVETMLGHAAADDPDCAALRARAALATGRDQDAEAILTAAAGRHPASESALELGLLLQHHGRKAEAGRLLLPLVALADADTPEQLLRAGRAARALGEFRAANEAFRQAAARAPDDPPTNTAWGELFLEKHNRDEASRCFKAALQSDPRFVDALVGLARATADDDLAAALASVRHALEVNPSSADANVLLADLLLDAGYEDAARQSAERALAVNARNLEAHAIVAAIAYLDDRPAEFERAISRALAINRTYGEAYRVVAAQLAHHYRFDDAVALSRKAVALDPDNVQARADFGMDLLRTGEEDEARAVLKQAFDADPYDAVIYNLLAVLDALQQFETFRDGDLVLRLDRRESAVLKEPVIALAHDALQTLSAKYGFTPAGPVLIEVFPHHDDFAVRNLGLPGLVGALGACFGRVVTLDSPKARPPGTFEWGATLWHELTHVITLQMSNQRVPRWLTEGISVYEEQRARPEWRRPMDEAFVRALAHSDLPAIRDIEGSFADPRTIALAYYQAGLIVGYLIDTYGQAKFNALVRSFAGGVGEESAFSRALGVNLDQLQAGFARSLDQSFGQVRRALAPLGLPLERASLDEMKALAAQHADSYEVQLELGLALRRQGDLDGATQALTRAADLFPAATGNDSPHAVLADIAGERGDVPAELGQMDKQLAQDPVNIDLARHMAGIMDGPDQDPVRAQRVWARIAALDPFDADAHATLGRLAMKRGDAAGAIRELRAAVAAGPGDAGANRCDLAEAYLLAGNAAKAKQETLAVLERAPSYERAQELLLKLVGGER
jgi:tetratricopeptide (TPR) repeat protein